MYSTFSGTDGYLYVFILQCNETPLENDPTLHKKEFRLESLVDLSVKNL